MSNVPRPLRKSLSSTEPCSTRQFRIVRKVAPLELGGAGDALRIEIERDHLGAQPTRRQAEQTAARARVEKALAVQPVDVEHLLQRVLSRADALVVENPQERGPVRTEAETLPGPDLMLPRRCRVGHRSWLFRHATAVDAAAVGIPLMKKPPPASRLTIFSGLSLRNRSIASVAPGQVVQA